jgi:hypothetical protein
MVVFMVNVVGHYSDSPVSIISGRVLAMLVRKMMVK